MNARPDADFLPVPPQRAPGHAWPDADTSPVPRHAARTLTDGGPLAHIDLNGQIYSLRITRAGKLILTK
jgi:hemin uptake protein HemP